jgi:peptide/nickel transport system substrate-binding protein
MADRRDDRPLSDPIARRPLSRRRLLELGAAGTGAALFTHLRAGGRLVGAQETPQRGGSLILGTAQQIQTLDPHKTGLRNNRNSWVGLYSFLSQYDDSGIPVPFLAESWEVAADGLS